MFNSRTKYYKIISNRWCIRIRSSGGIFGAPCRFRRRGIPRRTALNVCAEDKDMEFQGVPCQRWGQDVVLVRDDALGTRSRTTRRRCTEMLCHAELLTLWPWTLTSNLQNGWRCHGISWVATRQVLTTIYLPCVVRIGLSSAVLRVQVALLSQRGRAMLRVCQQLALIVQNVERSFLLLVT